MDGANHPVKKKRAAHLTKSATASARYNEGIATASAPLIEEKNRRKSTGFFVTG